MLKKVKPKTGKEKSCIKPYRCFFQKVYRMKDLAHFLMPLEGAFLLKTNIVSRTEPRMIKMK